jgi:hypothetical protein
MKTYTVHEPPQPPADRIDRAELLAFVKDGFDWGVFIFGPLALFSKGLFLATAAYVAVLVGVVLVLAAINADNAWVSLAIVALNAIAAYEASQFQRRKLDGKGWMTLGAVTGRNRDDCERRFLDSWLPRQPMIRPGRTPETGGGYEPAESAVHPIAAATPRSRLLGSLVDRLKGSRLKSTEPTGPAGAAGA